MNTPLDTILISPGVDYMPCPFCGSADARAQLELSNTGNFSRIVCVKCGAHGPIAGPMLTNAIVEAVGAWNSRSPSEVIA